MRALAVAALLLAAFLAGCAGESAPEPGNGLAGKTDSRVLEPGATAGNSASGDGGAAQAAPGNGEIRGQVIDDALLAVAGATVSLLGTAASTTTDSNGNFDFANVTPGQAELRITAETYRVHEGIVDVKADRITEVTVTLVPLDDRGPGYRQHLHDYWGDKNELVLMDQTLDWSKSGAYAQNYGLPGQLVTGLYQPSNGNYWMPFTIPDAGTGVPPIVLPGTAALRISVSWNDADVDADAFRIGLHSVTDVAGKFKDLEPLAKGVEVVVPVTAEQADNGHQIFSLWQFRIQPAARTPPVTILGPIQVKMIQIKGNVAPEPAHEDFWNGTTQYVVRAFDPPFVAAGQVVPGCGDPPNWAYNLLAPDKDRLVPPGAHRMTLRISWASTDAAGTPLDGKFLLRWKPANLPPDVSVKQYQTAPPKTSGATSAEYDIALQPGQTDAFYQKKSNWIFNIDRTDVPDDDQTCVTNLESRHRFNFEVIVHKDPTFV